MKTNWATTFGGENQGATRTKKLHLVLALAGLLLATPTLLLASPALNLAVQRAAFRPAPKFVGATIPEPPQQHAIWTAPATRLPTNFVNAVQPLFQAGMADPRACEYRAIELSVGNVWTGDGGVVATHGWVLPETVGETQRFAVAWSGAVYPVVAVGGKADLTTDIRELIEADHAFRTQLRFQRYGRLESELMSVSHTNMSLTKAALLLRLGDASLAEDFWLAYQAADNFTTQPVRELDPFLLLATDWLWALFNRAVCAHMRGDDPLALLTARSAAQARPLAEAEAERRGLTTRANGSVSDGTTQRIWFDFLNPLPELLADQERRAREPKRKMAMETGLDKFLTKKERMAALIQDLDQVAGRQWSQPGGVDYSMDSIFTALVKEGEEAVEPLLDSLDKDTRLTRSVSFHRDFFTHRKVHSVRDAYAGVLSQILDIRLAPSEFRGYWAKHKGASQTERWYQVLADDQADRKQWLQAAAHMAGVTDGTNFFQWHFFTWSSDAVRKYRTTGESLRSKRSPSVAELLAMRSLALAPTNYSSSSQCWEFSDAADFGLMLAVWDPQSALPVMRELMRRAGLMFAKRDTWTTGCSVVPERFARLAITRADNGDFAGLDEYARWIRQTSPKHIDNLPVVLAPLGRYPEQPAIKEAAALMFHSTNSAWAGTQLAQKLLHTRLLRVEGYRQLVLRALADKSPAGTVAISHAPYDREEIHYGNGGQRGRGAKLDALAPPAGEKINFRVCDFYANEMTRVEGMPAVQLYWPEAKRDEAVAACASFLQENSANLKLGPANRPGED